MTPPEPEKDGSRSQVDLLLAEALAEGATLKVAAERASCSLSTAKRRWSDRGFRAQVRELQDEARQARAHRVHAWWTAGEGQLATALVQLVQLVTSPQTPPAVKVARCGCCSTGSGPRSHPSWR